MAKLVLKHTMVLRNPETLGVEALRAGTEVPEWASELVHEDNLESAGKAPQSDGSGSGSGGADDSGSDKGYAGMKPDELKALADERELEVTGTGKDGNVLKGDLVAALEADDAAKA